MRVRISPSAQRSPRRRPAHGLAARMTSASAHGHGSVTNLATSRRSSRRGPPAERPTSPRRLRRAQRGEADSRRPNPPLGAGRGEYRPVEVNVGKDEIVEFSPSLFHYVGHLHIALSGFIAPTWFSVAALAWVRRAPRAAMGLGCRRGGSGTRSGRAPAGSPSQRPSTPSGTWGASIWRQWSSSWAPSCPSALLTGGKDPS